MSPRTGPFESQDDQRESTPSQETPQWPGKPNEVFQITAIGEVRVRHQTEFSAQHEDERVPAVRRATYQAHASVACMRQKQFNLGRWQILVGANVGGNRSHTRAVRPAH